MINFDFDIKEYSNKVNKTINNFLYKYCDNKYKEYIKNHDYYINIENMEMTDYRVKSGRYYIVYKKDEKEIPFHLAKKSFVNDSLQFSSFVDIVELFDDNNLIIASIDRYEQDFLEIEVYLISNISREVIDLVNSIKMNNIL